MEVEKINNVLYIKNLTIARFLIQQQHQRHLQVFINSDLSVTQAAEQLGITFHQMYALIKRLLSMNLIEVVRSEKRNGKSIRYYRAVATEFFIPNSILPIEEGLDYHLRELETTFIKNLIRTAWYEKNDRAGFKIWQNQDGKMNVFQVKHPELEVALHTVDTNQTIAFGNWHQLQLDFEDAQLFQNELSQLLKRFGQKKGSQTYLTILGMTPVIH